MRNLMNSAAAAAMRPVKEEFVTIDLDDEDEDVLCGEVNVECMMDAEELNTSDDDGDDWDTKIDHQYMKLLDSFREYGNTYLSDNPLRSIRYEVDNGGYDIRRFEAAVTKKDRNTVRVVTKKNVESKPHHVQASSRKTTTKEAGSRQRRENSVAEKSVEATLISTSHVKSNSQQQQHSSGNASEKEENLEDHDENYKAYLTWLVENLKSSRTRPEKEIQVKCEEEDYAMSLSDSDSDTIVVGDRPFLDGEDSPFVPSKSYKVVDLDDKRSDERSSWFRKEIMNVLKQPYTLTELTKLHNEASVHRRSTRHIELRDGTEFNFKTKKKRPSYLDEYPDFKKEYLDSLHEADERKALNLLRGFIFYLTNVVRDDAFKPWLD
ncbi:PREDICTED: uncharacterized protein LOC104743436, partial [Camelina sativa]|uniref:Uncharacterized protein LOC104743436 n=1 Tax=Camelina sativa TaxID=90675 RepID=A0ABM0VY07_CAMSA